MKLMPCPLNGPRNIDEFAYGGEFRPHPDPREMCDAAWIDHLYFSENRAGRVREWWYHIPSGYWFVADRDTQTDEIVETYPVEVAAALAPLSS